MKIPNFLVTLGIASFITTLAVVDMSRNLETFAYVSTSKLTHENMSQANETLMISKSSSYGAFYVSKSFNDNRAYYHLRQNTDCSLNGNSPVYVHWHMENGTTENLLSEEVEGFGIASQSVSGNNVIIELNGLKNRGISRQIRIQSYGSNGDCRAKAFMEINGKEQQLRNAHVDFIKRNRCIPNPFGSDLCTLVGVTVKGIYLYPVSGEREIISCRSNCEFGLNWL